MREERGVLCGVALCCVVLCCVVEGLQGEDRREKGKRRRKDGLNSYRTST